MQIIYIDDPLPGIIRAINEGRKIKKFILSEEEYIELCKTLREKGHEPVLQILLTAQTIFGIPIKIKGR